MIEHERTGWIDATNWRLSRIVMVFPVLIVMVMFYEIVMRYVFGDGTLWVNEMSLWLGGAFYLVSGLYVMQQRSHIRILILYDIMPLSVRRIFDVISLLCLIAFTLSLVWGGFNEAYQNLLNWERSGTAWNPPVPAVMKPMVLIVLVLIAVQAASNVIFDWNTPLKKLSASGVDDESIREIRNAQSSRGSQE